MAIIESASTTFSSSARSARAAQCGARRRRRRPRALVFVGGEAGVGKTSSSAASATSRPLGPLLWGGCDPLATPRPLGPFLEIAETRGIDGRARSVERAARRRRRAAGRRPRAGRSSSSSRTRTGRTRARWTSCGSSAGGSRRRPVSSLVTYRDDELARDHPLRIALGDLATAAAVERLAVRPLSRDGVARLAGAATSTSTSSGASPPGNPFYVTELLANGAERGARHGARPRAGRVAQLGPQATAVVEATAVAPPSLDAELLLAVCGEATDSVDECLASGVLHGDRRRRRVPARALARGRRGVALAGAATRAAPLGAAGAHGRTPCACRPRTHRASRRGGGRPGRGAPVRAGGGGAGGEGRRVPRGSGPVRAGAALRRRPAARRPRRPPRGPLPGAATSQTTRPRRSTSSARRSGAAGRRAPRWRRPARSRSWPTTSGAAATSARRTRPSSARRSWPRAFPSSASTPTCSTREACQALYGGDLGGCSRARPPRSRSASASATTTSRVTLGSPSAPQRHAATSSDGLRLIEEAVETARRNGEHEVAARG